MILGDYTFEWLPDEMTIPEAKKTVAVMPTYSGSAIFQWAHTLEGAQVTLKWDWMSILQYQSLRLEYLKTEEITFTVSDTVSYDVIVLDLQGSYFKVNLDDLDYRKDVQLVLDIRRIQS